MTLWKNAKSSKERKSARTSGLEASSASNSDPQISRTCIALKFVPVMFVESGVTHTKTGMISRMTKCHLETNTQFQTSGSNRNLTCNYEYGCCCYGIENFNGVGTDQPSDPLDKED